MFVIYGGSFCGFTYFSTVTEVGKLECNQSYWMVPGTGED